ncbi:MAG: tryptophan synthase subunit alpha [Candidatus Anammoxibacter sp.]
MNRIDKRFKELKQKNETAFIPFLTAGDPTLSATTDIIIDLDKRGADVIELGFPYTDPIADGPVIQASYSRVLSNGITIGKIFDTIRDIRKKSEIPIVAMVSYSIVYKFGYKKFIADAQNAGFDGATIPDLPVEEAAEIFDVGRERDFKIVCFAAPTTTNKRLDIITTRTDGFLYYIAVVGITGVRKSLPDDIPENIKKIREKTNCPIAVGFGVSTPEQAASVGKIADGVIVGSAIIREIEKSLNSPPQALIKHVGEFTKKLILAAKGK